jgi:glutaminyl-peptide cyclotransferase
MCALGLALAGCDKKSAVPGTPAPEANSSAKAPGPAPVLKTTVPPVKALPKFKVSTAPPPREIWKEFSGEKAFTEVKKQVDLGPRPAGSAELEQARGLLTTSLEGTGWEVERQEFTDNTPRGSVKFVNLIARFAADGSRPVPRTTQRAIVCSHYDTKRFSTIRFLGANDAASSTGALVELARVLALDPVFAAQFELVFFDGEEAFVQFTETDGLYGSRYYARQLRETSRAAQFKFGILWDMIGDSDLTITLSPDSPIDLVKSILASADALALREHFSFYNRNIFDDHIPLNQAKIPTIDLIDFDFLYWHTADDTLPRLSAESLQKVGAVTLHYLRGALPR